ncbi:hypothetical protein [Candidatus Fokinia crypta]|uniref:Uncharacterized protein n=1 Tax=Candidatus Fokinia crypta TaxID=1920990 RepID=A0ABZ0UPE5_9RICK|nr:hypothetical protein [Candidatus Fokinia cryptica]WPX97986.1 hypothetical protein Fokcrypt_00513 [Candidatus Fokinia cryptica]
MKKKLTLIFGVVFCIVIIIAFFYFYRQKDINERHFGALLKEKFASHGLIFDYLSIVQKNDSFILDNVTIVGALPIFKTEVLFDKIKITNGVTSIEVEFIGEVKISIQQSMDYNTPSKFTTYSSVALRDYKQLKIFLPINKNAESTPNYTSFKSIISNAKLYIDNKEKAILKECNIDVTGNPNIERLINIKMQFEDVNQIHQNEQLYSLDVHVINHENEKEDMYEIQKFFMKSNMYAIKMHGDISFYNLNSLQESESNTDMHYVKSENIIVHLQNYEEISATMTNLVERFYQNFFESHNKSTSKISKHGLQMAIKSLIEFISQDIRDDESTIHIAYDEKNGMTFSGKTNDDLVKFVKIFQLTKKDELSK